MATLNGTAPAYVAVLAAKGRRARQGRRRCGKVNRVENTARDGVVILRFLTVNSATPDIGAVHFTPRSNGDGPVLLTPRDEGCEGDEIAPVTPDRVHATNAARTLIYNIKTGAWDGELCALLGSPMSLLPEVKDSAAEFGSTDPAIFGRAIPIRGVAGDQQAAAVGQACFQPGMMKATYGTGCFALLNTGADLVLSKNRLLTTIAYQVNGQPTYALEGSIFGAGGVVQWLRDGLNIIATAGETQGLAEQADPSQDVILVPAFTGLGAPYWRPDCRGAIFGVTRSTGAAELAKAAFESVGYQTRDLLEAMCADWGHAGESVLRVDGGMVASDGAIQFLADISGAPVDRPVVSETTALGAAYLAGLQSGLCQEPARFAESWVLERRFASAMAADLRAAKHARWGRAVASTLMV